MTPEPTQFAEIRRLLAAFYRPDEIEKWLTTPQPLLHGYRAAEDPDGALRLAHQLDEGAYL